MASGSGDIPVADLIRAQRLTFPAWSKGNMALRAAWTATGMSPLLEARAPFTDLHVKMVSVSTKPRQAQVPASKRHMAESFVIKFSFLALSRH